MLILTLSIGSFLALVWPTADAIPDEIFFFVDGVLYALVAPLAPILMTLMYYDLRIRNENENLVEALAGLGNAARPHHLQEPLMPNTLLNRRGAVNIALLLLLAIALLLLPLLRRL